MTTRIRRGWKNVHRKVREVRMFARAMQDARLRDDAAIVAGCEGDTCTLQPREAHNG